MEELSRPYTWHTCAALLTLILTSFPIAAQSTVQARIDSDLAADRPIVVHVAVALCDNANQGIVPVPAAIGNGQDPNSNLYWGAMYGVRTFLTRKGGWKKVATLPAANDAILERIVFHDQIKRGAQTVPVYIVADAWDGAKIRDSLETFTAYTAGRKEEKISFEVEGETIQLAAGGAAHVIAYVGHNGLMDFSLGPKPEANGGVRGAIILACASKPYFEDSLKRANAEPLLLTTGFMAPEAYTLDAALRSFVSGASPDTVIEAAASAYHQYQKCGIKGARRLFGATP